MATTTLRVIRDPHQRPGIVSVIGERCVLTTSEGSFPIEAGIYVHPSDPRSDAQICADGQIWLLATQAMGEPN